MRAIGVVGGRGYSGRRWERLFVVLVLGSGSKDQVVLKRPSGTRECGELRNMSETQSDMPLYPSS